MPWVHVALQRLDREIAGARQQHAKFLKIIHGYGSSGEGGDIRIAVQKRLVEMTGRDEIRACIFGEKWAKSDEQTWALINANVELKQDHDLGKKNLGITIVVL
jgi:DNA-nicking Smr family endonuclease